MRILFENMKYDKKWINKNTCEIDFKNMEDLE